jgi:RNA 2',3'-cyclic 3'-phosphodiesterase
MRLFIAIDIENKLKNNIFNLQKMLEGFGKIKFIEPENLHYTLKFLGEVPEKEIESTVKKIREIKLNKFKVHIKGIGFFDSEKYIRVLWLDCDKGSEELKSIAEILEKKLSYIREDEYSYRPHLTIGRISFVENREGLIKAIKENENIEIGEFIVNKISLKQSILTTKGPVYKDYKTFEAGNE